MPHVEPGTIAVYSDIGCPWAHLCTHRQSKTVSMRHVILDVARSVPGLDATALAERLDEGAARAALMEEIRRALDDDDVKGSPHVFLAGGGQMHNPGIEMEWEGEHGKGFPVVGSDDPSVYADIVRRSATRIEEAS